VHHGYPGGRGVFPAGNFRLPGYREDMGNGDEVLQRTRRRIAELRRRTLELAERSKELASKEPPRGSSARRGSSAQEVQRAADQADRARANAAAARARAVLACLRSAEAHEAAANRYEKLAAGGFGDIEEHRRRAREHREGSAADRQAAADGSLPAD